MIASKSLFESKTFWFNVLAIAVLVASQFGFSTHTLDQDTVDTVLKILAGVTAVANVGLRLATKQPVTVTGKTE